jgi:sortase (surface protein transpeptidase)
MKVTWNPLAVLRLLRTLISVPTLVHPRRSIVTRPRIIVPLLLAVVVLAAAGGTYLWMNRDDAGDRVEIAHEAGLDAAPAESGDTEGLGGVPQLGEEYLRAVETALREQMAAEAAQAEAEEARKAAEAYAAERGIGEKIAADAIQQWGRGQLLLAMPSIGVTAAVTQIGYERDGRTPSTPNTPWGVGWYTFTDFPGRPGNAVMSGHVDWYTGAPAVFGRLRSVGLGDSIYMVLADGTPVSYKVERAEWVTPYTANVGEIFGITDREAITFITCGGTWDPVAHDYSHRLIVRAYRTW